MARVLVLLAMCAAGVANAALIGSPELIERSLPGAPAGLVVNGMLINFDGQLFGQQLLVTLTQGAIFQDALNPGEGPPNPMFFPVFPSMEWDTYVTLGAFASSPTSSTLLVVGHATELGASGPMRFDTEVLNVAWAPAPGVVFNGGAHFPIAQITLTDTAQGSWRLFSSSGGVGRIVSGGILDGRLYNVPEPVSLLLAGFGVIAAVVHRYSPAFS